MVSDVFTFRPRLGADGGFVATGVVPSIAKALRDRGEPVGDLLFRAGPDEVAVDWPEAYSVEEGSAQ